MQARQAPDVLIVGGGPAGTTMGTHLARAGHEVLLLEKDRHPRFHIGESLLPMNLPLLDRLGVLEEVERLGVLKRGADFTYSDGGDFRTYRFDRALGDSPPHAFEVRRSEFDELLFRRCVDSGVTAVEGETVERVELAGKGRHRVTSRDEEGRTREWTPRFLVDASGRDTLLAGRRRWKRRNPRHASAAIFSHFRGAERRPGEDAGNISVYWFPQGWIWMIPLPDDLMSVGAVCWPEYLKQRRGSPEEFLQQTLAKCPPARQRLETAERALPVRVTGNYSYQGARLWGDGYVLLGDAYAFVDPVFSSGVYLAMNSAEKAVPLVQSWLRGERRSYRREARRYADRIHRGLSNFSWFIYRFNTPAMRNLFAHPRNLFGVEQAVISMLAGDVFGNAPVQRRLWLFRLLYGISFLLTLRESLSARRRRLRNARLEFS